MTSPQEPQDRIEAPGTNDDKELAQAFKRGEPGAYEAIYARYQPRVRSVCRRMLSNPNDVDEASQEAFLRVYQALPRFNGRYQLGAWITRITTNVCLDQLRSRSRKPSIPSTIEEIDAEISHLQFEEGPESFVMRRAESRHVRKVLESLPPMHRAAIVLRDFEGLSYEQVAVALGITDVQCKALIHRARQNFKKSWVPASVAGLLPFRFFSKFRKAETSVADQTSHMARAAPQLADVAASASQTAVTCSSFLSSCGTLVTERFGTAAATAVIAVGSLAAGAQVATPHRTQDEVATVLVATESARPQMRQRAPIERAKDKQDAGHQPAADQPARPDPVDTPPPAPDATPPTPEPSEPPKDDGGVDKTPQDPPAEPAPFQAFIGFDHGSAIPASQVTSNEATVDCDKGMVTQSLVTTVWDGSVSYPARMTLSTAPTVGFDLTITKDGNDYTYDAGAPSIASTRNGDEMSLSFFGSYSWVGNNPGSANLPHYGQFKASLTLDCAAFRVVTENITLYLQ